MYLEKEEFLVGEMEGGIFRQGRATKMARFGKDTEIIEIQKIK